MKASRFPLVEDVAGRTRVDFGDAAVAVTSLPMAPPEIEEILRSGRWIVLCFAVWSGPDREAIDVAIEVSGRGAGARVAVRPFDEFEEFTSWCLAAPKTTLSPIWLLLEGGELVDSCVGPSGADEISALEGRKPRSTRKDQAP